MLIKASTKSKKIIKNDKKNIIFSEKSRTFSPEKLENGKVLKFWMSLIEGIVLRNYKQIRKSIRKFIINLENSNLLI